MSLQHYPKDDHVNSWFTTLTQDERLHYLLHNALKKRALENTVKEKGISQ